MMVLGKWLSTSDSRDGICTVAYLKCITDVVADQHNRGVTDSVPNS